jgi:hypothetical protein
MPNFRKIHIFLTVLAVFIFLPQAAFATTSIEFYETGTVLNFGNFAITDNATSQTLTVLVDESGCNGESHSGGITVNSPPSCGVYNLTGFDANDSYSVIIGFQNLVKSGVPNQFEIDDFTTNTTAADSSGEATLYIGATLHTITGNGVYPNGGYSGIMDITINFD